MKARLIRHEVLPFIAALGVLVLVAALVDALLHMLNAVWIGRYLGIPGTLLILGSVAYSLRKRKLIRSGQPAQFLRWHERMSWVGALMVLVHAGIHFNSILGWLAVIAMMINVASGLTGKFLLARSRQRMDEARLHMRQRGLSGDDVQERLYWDSLTFDIVKQWRAVHFPITAAFAVLATAHIVAVFLFWGWK
jgi:hypothetical protein